MGMDSDEHVFRCVQCNSKVDTEELTFCGQSCQETWWGHHNGEWMSGDE